MINVDNLIKKHQNKIALENFPTGKGELVTGHRKTYFDQATKSAMKEFAEKLLELASENADTTFAPIMRGHEIVVDKDTITSVINQIKF